MFRTKHNENKKNTDAVSSSTQNSYISRTVTIYEEKSRSIKTSSNVKMGNFTTSNKSLPALGLGNSNHLLPPEANRRERSKSTVIDAKPINLNYQPVYRNSPAYRSFNARIPVVAGTSNNNVPGIKPSLSTLTVPNISAIPPKISEKPIKKLVVKKTGKIYDKDTKLPTYTTSSKHRGEALIINNIMFEGEHERLGAEFDHKRLKDLFKQIGFNVKVKPDLTKKELESSVKKFSENSSLRTADISVVVVMSHGTKNDILGGTEVFGIDEKGVLIETLLQYFSGEKCKYMHGKPKIFIFQCCRGDNKQFVQNDARPPSTLRPHADMLIAYSTLPGFVSHRDPEYGTWYIQTLCDVFSKNAHEYHVEDMLKLVDFELGQIGGCYKQTSSYENRGFKRCYLHPL